MINNSHLLGLFGGTAPLSLDPTAASLNRASRRQPTPPWSPDAEAPKQDALVRSALAGRRLINEDGAQLDVKSASADYRKLFALYQGLSTLSALANRSGTTGVSSLELAQLRPAAAHPALGTLNQTMKRPAGAGLWRLP